MSKITMDEVAKEWMRLGLKECSVHVGPPPREEGWLSGAELAELWKINRTTLNRKMAMMLRKGEVERHKGHYSDGYYWRIVKKGKK